MNPTLSHDLSRMLVVYVHVISCAIAIGFAFFADYRILKARGQPRSRDIEVVEQVSDFVALALAALWASGIAIVLIDFGHIPALSELWAKPKLMAKLVVVGTLTLNGVFLHLYALPRLRQINLAAALMGGVSAASWLFAVFLGVGKPLAALFTLNQFLALYALALLGGVGAASWVFRRHAAGAAPQASVWAPTLVLDGR